MFIVFMVNLFYCGPALVYDLSELKKRLSNPPVNGARIFATIAQFTWKTTCQVICKVPCPPVLIHAILYARENM